MTEEQYRNRLIEVEEEKIQAIKSVRSILGVISIHLGIIAAIAGMLVIAITL